MSAGDSGLPAAFRWALESTADPDRAACDWLAREIVPRATCAAHAVADSRTTLDELRALKHAFKALRQSAVSVSERNRAARLYAATIAAALLRFDERITRQRDEALQRAFRALIDDHDGDERLRDIATAAMARLRPA